MSEKPPSDEMKYPTACDRWRQTNETILEDAMHCLRHSAYPQLWKITCEFYQGLLTLHGVVSSYFFKQLAQAAVAEVREVDEVANHLEVRYAALASKEKT
jgi:osmotically-inducible protein OsmY